MCSHTFIEKKIHKSEVEIDVLGLEKEDCVYLECSIHGDEDCECDSLCGSCRYLDEDTWMLFDDLNTSNMWMVLRN